MKYTVKSIEEDLDYGCEERPDSIPVMAVVTLLDENQEIVVNKFPDEKLMEEEIQTGDTVIIDENGMLCKALMEDWTKYCNTKNVDVQRFVSMMEKVKEGKSVDWICPFCGGRVERLEQSGSHTVIGCTQCDMRINLDN